MVTQLMSDIEAIVTRWLDKKNIEYQFQTSLAGGFFELGGAVVDVIIPDLNLAWRIQGDYFHKQPSQAARDDIQRETLEADGWIVIDIWGSDLETPEEVEKTLTKALRGEEVLQ